MLRNVCRICSVKVNKKGILNLFDKKSRKLLEQIKLLTGVLLKPNGLPELICVQCQLDLNIAIEFRQRCLNCQGTQKRISRASKLKSSATEANDGEDIVSSSESGQFDTELDMKIGIDLDEDIASNTDMRDPLNQNDFESPNTEVELKVEHIGTNSDNKYENSSTALNLELGARTRSKRRRIAVPVKVPIKLGSSSEESTEESSNDSDGESDWVEGEKNVLQQCNICGKVVMGKYALESHLKSHSNVKSFQCQLCPSRFNTKGQLKSHQVTHTGEKNFPCRYCDRVYSNTSSRVRHERNHTNERPFLCFQCGKSFTSSYVYKQHMIIHTGKRLFRCDLCDRSFKYKSHLRTHYLSNAHKLKEEKHIVLKSK